MTVEWEKLFKILTQGSLNRMIEIKNMFLIFKCRYDIKYFMRAIFVIGGLAITSYNISFNLRMYLLNVTKTEMSIETDTTTAFPSVTICLNSIHSRGRLD